MLLSGLADATMASRVLKPNKMLAPNTMCVQCDESVANFRTGPGRKWKLRDQRDPGWIYHRLPEQHQAIYAMYRTKLRKDVLQCSPKNKRNQKLKELLQLKFLRKRKLCSSYEKLKSPELKIVKRTEA